MRHVINHQVVLAQAPEGPLATWLDKFADAASRQGYTRSSICRRIRLAAGFSRWLGQEGIDLSCINSEHPAQYLRYRMDLLQAGVDRAVIALWLGHESVETTQIYLEATLAMKERALARTTPPIGKPGRYQLGDRLLGFLSSL